MICKTIDGTENDHIVCIMYTILHQIIRIMLLQFDRFRVSKFKNIGAWNTVASQCRTKQHRIDRYSVTTAWGIRFANPLLLHGGTRTTIFLSDNVILKFLF